MNALPPNEGRSWWLREALARPEFAGDPCPPLETDTKADVVILGGGYTGMWTAWFLKELDPGLDIVLLEQDICGGGPSGRNGGFVNSFWDDLDFLAARFGDVSALRICRAGQESVDGIGRFCTEHEIDAWFAAEGSLSVASSTAQIGSWAELVMTVDRLGLSDIITVLSRDEVRAGAAVLAVNAWAKHWRRFKRAITVRGSYIVMTAPAPDRLAAINWTGGLGVSDHRSAVHYLRTTPDGRIAFGIGGMQPDLARHIDPRFGYDEASIRVAVDDLHRIFPSFADVPVEAGWGGPIDVSADHLPFFGTFEDGNVHYGLGFTGNGVGPAHLGGRILAHRVLAKYDDVLALPLVDLQPRRFPPEPIRSVGAMVTNRAIHRRDVALDGEDTPNPFVDFVAKLPRKLGYNLGP